MTIKKYPCSCCGYITLNEKEQGTYEICEICFWENDSAQLDNPDYIGGANKVSLRQAQKNFLEFGACEMEMIKNVRQTNKTEIRDDNWKRVE